MTVRRPILAGLAALSAAACGDSSTGPDGTVPVSLSVAVARTAPAAAALLPTTRQEVYEDGANTLVIDRVALVVREVELERLSDDDCDDLDDDGRSDDDDCEEFEAGPFLLELPLDGSVEQAFVLDVEPDTYKELEFEIHKPGDDDAEERAFVREHPDFDDVSIRVEGTWNGRSFVFLQDMSAEQEIDLVPNLVVTEDSGPVNVTLSLDISGWFRDRSGGLIDPATANEGGENEDRVEDNIERSFDAFEDDDRDGDDDDDD